MVKPRFSPRPALPIKSAMMLTLLVGGLSACSTPQAIFLNAGPCYTLVPQEWLKGVKSAPLPVDKTVGGWISHDVAQTGKIDEANRNTTDTYGVIKQCEDRDQKIMANLQKPWWKVW